MSGIGLGLPIGERIREGLVASLPHGVRTLYSRTRTSLRVGWSESGRLVDAPALPAGGILDFRLAWLPHPVFVRTASTDAETLEACLVREYYGYLHPPDPVRFIVDAGANSGYASIFFLQRFPQAAVAALEPDPDNFAMAQRNLEPYGDRVTLMPLAIWPTASELRLVRRHRHDASQTVESSVDGVACAAIDPLTLLQKHKQERINVFKCDIEGAERQLFAESDAWLERTDHIAIEIHGPAAYQIVSAATRRHGFSCRVSHRLHYFSRPRPA
jgi:FkbM family methyltransferase